MDGNYGCSSNNIQPKVDNLIQLSDEHKHDLSEFDPFAPVPPQPRPRRPARPPPPPPSTARSAAPATVATMKPSRSRSVLGASPDMVNLKFGNGAPIVEQPKRMDGEESMNTQYASRNSFKNKSASFVSYLGSPTENISAAEEFQKARTLDHIKSSSTSDMAQIGGSSFAALNDITGATSHNAMTDKLWGLGQRYDLMQLVMAKRQEDYTTRKPFRFFVGTWNVNGQLPAQELDPWLACDEDPPDIYIIGFQELDLSKEAFVFSESSREEEWRQSVTRALHPKAQYRLVKLNRLVGMMVLIFAQIRHIPNIVGVDQRHVGTGLLGKMGNKGGVGVSFSIHGTSICAVNTHLAAHSEEIQRRNQDYSDICSRMKFNDGITVFQHDVLVWLGDLNYRIDKVAPDLVKECIGEEKYKLLLESDQLLCQRREGNVFHGFEEGEIRFRPTYKYNPGSDDWDSSEKFRTPAWCDRVLWRESALITKANTKKKAVKAVDLREYRSHPALKLSDHKPVSALFDIAVKIVNESRYRQVYEEEMRNLDKMENEWLPSITLSQQALDFGTIKFQQASLQTIELYNTGQVPCNFEFISKLDSGPICKPWLTISKPKGFILQGDKVEIEFEVYVNKTTAPNLNKGEDNIDDILILHLVGGKDFFISLNGTYSPSCFGTSIEALCRMTEPIEQIDRKEIARLSGISAVGANQTDPVDGPLQVPKELWWLLEHLYHNAKTQHDLFQQPGLHSELQQIQECLDSRMPTSGRLLPGSNHSVAEALLIFLEALPEPVIPFDYYTPCIDVADSYELASGLLQTLSPRHLHVFKYLLSFLQELPRHEGENKLNPHLIATIFSGLILRPQPSQKKVGFEVRLDRQRATQFVEMFLRRPLRD